MPNIFHNSLSLGYPVSGPAPPYPTSGLIARYDFNDTLNDTYGSFNGLTSYHASPIWSYETGKINKSYQSNFAGAGTGTHTLINNTDASVYNVMAGTGKEFAFSLWAKITNTSQNLGYAFAFGNGNTCIGKFGWYYTGGQLETIFFDTNYILKFRGTDYRDSQWHHYVVNQGSTYIKLYIDNVEKASASRKNFGTSNLCLVGSAETDALSQAIYGNVDLLYIYNKALTTDEISELYNGGAGI